MKVERICEKCGKMVNVEFVKESIIESDDVGHLKVKYYECSCGANNIVQYDNKATEQMVKTSENILIDAIKKKAKGQTPSEKKKRKMESLNKKIKSMRDELFKKYHGKVEINVK